MNFKMWIETNELIRPKLFEKIKQLKGRYSGVHFSPSEQLSFNLKPFHYDPIGIYVFPKNYMLQGGLEKNQGFARKYYAFLIEETPNAKVLSLDMTLQDAENLLTKMGVDKNLLNSDEIYHNTINSNTPGHKFWGVLEHIRKKDQMSKNMSWNSFFAKTGYNVLYDPGLGVVHSNEPTQIIYLDHKAYKVVDVIKNNNNYSLLLNFANFFPDFRIHKQRRRGLDSERQIIRLVRDNDAKLSPEEITIETSSFSEETIRVKVYGHVITEKDSTQPSYSDGKEWYLTIKSKEDLEKLVIEVKNFMDSTERTKKRLLDKEYSFINNISQVYKLRIDPNFPAAIEKKYRNNTSFDIKQSTFQTYNDGKVESSHDALVLSIKKNNSDGPNGWIRYFYYYGHKPTGNIEKDIKMLIQGIKEKIQEDIEDENSRKKYDAPHALKFVDFLDKKVFVKR